MKWLEEKVEDSGMMDTYRDSFSEDQFDYLVNHSHFDLGMITPDDQAELVKQIRDKFDKLIKLSYPKLNLPEIDKLDWHLTAIDILKNVMLSRMEREGKTRTDYIGLAINIVNDLREFKTRKSAGMFATN